MMAAASPRADATADAASDFHELWRAEVRRLDAVESLAASPQPVADAQAGRGLLRADLDDLVLGVKAGAIPDRRSGHLPAAGAGLFLRRRVVHFAVLTLRSSF
jgi:hypothetical protein